MHLEARYEGIGRIVAREAKVEDPGPGQVRVRVERCGICGSDLHCFRGHAPQPAACPGHEMSGVVEALGRGVAAVREGDRVAVEPALRCGTCSACRSGDYHLCARLSLCGRWRAVCLAVADAGRLVDVQVAAHAVQARLAVQVQRR